MPRRTLIIVIALTALVVPSIIILFVVERNPQLQNAIFRGNANAGLNNNLSVANVNTNTEPENPDQAAVTFVARNFAEVYGSGNNQNNFIHLQAAQIYGTQNFNDFLNRTIAQERLTTPTDPYHSLVTKALVMNVTRLTASLASVTVDTQRVETLDRDESVYYQKLFLDLSKQGTEWKVNAASWEPR